MLCYLCAASCRVTISQRLLGQLYQGHTANNPSKVRGELGVERKGTIPMLKKFSSYVVFLTAGIVAVASVTIWIYASNLRDAHVLRISSIGNLITMVVGFIGLIVLVVYTKETYLLRRAAEEQTENGIKPVIRLTISSREVGLAENMAIETMALTNVGMGPAFNVAVSPISGIDVKLQFDVMPIIESRETVRLAFHILQSGEYNGMSRQVTLLEHLMQKGNFPEEMKVTAEFESVSGQWYRALHQVRNPIGKKQLQTLFIRQEKVERL